ncbi:MAG: hypothetical protein GX606_04640 [Elusimicrobia bacterium]|nr:hypothetical protein [Elusimicrobiota bacterium]
MTVLLVLKSEVPEGIRVLVRVEPPYLRGRVWGLVREHRLREAFSTVLEKGVFEKHLPLGARYPTLPDLTFIEDLI